MIRMRQLIPVLALLALAACSGKSVWAPDEAIAAAAYVAVDEPPSLTLVTVINNGNGSGGHSALVINAHQKVVFDPAGNFKTPQAPERNDLVYGMYPEMLAAYYGFHARKEWHVVTQRIVVTPEIAELAFQSAKNYGAVPSAYCASSVSAILSGIPGFEHITRSMSPKRLMRDFAELPGVTTDKIYEDD
ncbi:MAG: hypothetical protein K8F59_07695 [Rhodobacteraceae bacterium]|nr:hypothetical protein [Paracoccaceae bacterium]MCB1367245.1 hypothetical protein [Paracoccaceae bacterium]